MTENSNGRIYRLGRPGGYMRIKPTLFSVTAATGVFGIVWVFLAAEGGLGYLLVGWIPAGLAALLALALLGVLASGMQK